MAAGLDVDLWRNVYTLNFQRIAGPGGRTEPSLSAYLPYHAQGSTSPGDRTMSAITSWQFSVDGVGQVQVYGYEIGYAGGFVLAGFGDGRRYGLRGVGSRRQPRSRSR